MWFRGQKITLVNDDPWSRYDGGFIEVIIKFPEFGVVYSIREIVEDHYSFGFRLNEFYNPELPTTWGAEEPYFDHRRFRPVVEKKTDIGIFERILKTRTMVGVE